MSDDDTIDEELYAPFYALRPLLSNLDMASERARKINESIIADLVGESPIAPPPSDRPRETTNLLSAILGVYSCIDRFKIFEDMFRIYPWRGRISKTAHFESTFYLFAHETYILKERLKKFLDAVEAFDKANATPLDVRKIRKDVLARHKSVFGTMVRMRGSHVHEDETMAREIKRVGLLGILRMSKDPPYELLYQMALKDARTEWVKKSQAAHESSCEIAKMAFRLTRVSWSKLA